MFQAALILSFLCKEVLSCISTKSPDGLPSVTTTTSTTTTTTSTTTTTTPTNDMCQLCPDPYFCNPSVLPGCIPESSLAPPPMVVRGAGECTFTVTVGITGGTIYLQNTAGGPYNSFTSSTTTFTCGDYPDNQWKTPGGDTFVHVAST